MGVLLTMDDDDVDPHDTPTVPGVYIVPESVFAADEADTDPLLEDPSSWDSDEDTKRFRVLR
jgi:hypothetical protein